MPYIEHDKTDFIDYPQPTVEEIKDKVRAIDFEAQKAAKNLLRAKSIAYRRGFSLSELVDKNRFKEQ